MAYWLYDPDEDTIEGPLTAKMADRDHHDTDAGVTWSPFVVKADTMELAQELAKEWVELWKDEDRDDVGDMMLMERRWKPGRTYRILQRAV